MGILSLVIRNQKNQTCWPIRIPRNSQENFCSGVLCLVRAISLWILQKFSEQLFYRKHSSWLVNYFLLAFLWVTLNRFNALLFWCFHCWLWASKCWLGCGTLVQFCPPNLLLKNDIYQIWCTTLLTLIIVLNTQVLFYLLQSITCSKTWH